jgi:hypothetical protein
MDYLKQQDGVEPNSHLLYSPSNLALGNGGEVQWDFPRRPQFRGRHVLSSSC